MISRNKTASFALVSGIFAAIGASVPANAQSVLYDAPYSFPQTNRASMAVVIKQAESGMFTTATGGSGDGSGGAPIFLCGGSGGGGSTTSSSSSATANSSCIILNNSNGQVIVDQDSKGSQSSSSDIDQINEALNNNPATQQRAAGARPVREPGVRNGAKSRR